MSEESRTEASQRTLSLDPVGSPPSGLPLALAGAPAPLAIGVASATLCTLDQRLADARAALGVSTLMS